MGLLQSASGERSSAARLRAKHDSPHATGGTGPHLTDPELRAKLDEALGKFYQNPRTVVVPVAYRSKKYIMLGSVVSGVAYVATTVWLRRLRG